MEHEQEFPIEQVMDAYRISGADKDDPTFRRLSELSDDPKLEDRLRAIQQFDLRMRDVIGQVDAPAGLPERLLRSLFGDPVVDASCGRLAPAAPAAVSPVSLLKAERKWSRRRWLQIGIGSSAVAACGGLLAAWLLRPKIDVATIALHVATGFEGAPSWLELLHREPWRTERGQLSASLPSALQSYRQIQTIHTSLLAAVQAYDVSGVGSGQAAYLFVARPVRVQLVNVPAGIPLKPQDLTGTWHVAVWQDLSGWLYALAFQGGMSRYRQLTSGGSTLV